MHRNLFTMTLELLVAVVGLHFQGGKSSGFRATFNQPDLIMFRLSRLHHLTGWVVIVGNAATAHVGDLCWPEHL